MHHTSEKDEAGFVIERRQTNKKLMEVQSHSPVAKASDLLHRVHWSELKSRY